MNNTELGMEIDQTPLEVAAEDLARLNRNKMALEESIDAQTGVVMDELENAGMTSIYTDGFTFFLKEKHEKKLMTKKPRVEDE